MSRNEFIEELDNVRSICIDRPGPDQTDRLIAWHNARAQICLYDETYQLRLAINRATESVDRASDKTAEAIAEASKQSTNLAKKVFWLNIILASATILGTLFAGIQLYQIWK